MSNTVEAHTWSGTRHKFGVPQYLYGKWFRRALCNANYTTDERCAKRPEKKRCKTCFPEPSVTPPTYTEVQLAKDVISLARDGGMPATYWLTDTRIERACAVLGIDPPEAHEMEADD